MRMSALDVALSRLYRLPSLPITRLSAVTRGG